MSGFGLDWEGASRSYIFQFLTTARELLHSHSDYSPVCHVCFTPPSIPALHFYPLLCFSFSYSLVPQPPRKYCTAPLLCYSVTYPFSLPSASHPPPPPSGGERPYIGQMGLRLLNSGLIWLGVIQYRTKKSAMAKKRFGFSAIFSSALQCCF
jgi:hypothetical protein